MAERLRDQTIQSLPTDAFSSGLQVSWRRHHPSARVCVVVGDIDLLTAPLLHQALTDGQPDQRMPDLVVDLSQVAFFSLAGARVLAEMAERSAPRERIRLVASRQVARTLEVSGFEPYFVVHRSLDDALAGLAAPDGPPDPAGNGASGPASCG